MAKRFSELIQERVFGVGNRRQLKRFYAEVRGAVKSETLGLEGHSLPASMNAWIAQLGSEHKPLAADQDVIDFSITEDERLARWRERFRQETAAVRSSLYLSASSAELLREMQALTRAKEASMVGAGAKKEDLVSALSDLQAAVAELLSAYARVRGPLRLPDLELDPARVKVRKPAKDSG